MAGKGRGDAGGKHPFVQGVHGVRYQVKDIARSVAFYTTHLGFTLEHQQPPAFASVSLGACRSCSAVRERPDPGRCPVDKNRNPADGTVSC
jgi:catechol 2,3-dioxygenase-like lactoylglutathione lyase family enzyme